ncbi:MAG: hypothetical protein Q8O19_00790, partial [Rectinemataceae bacterium]|nr:hypothetical protein [Rectinemataceae bacterium]
MKKHTRSIVGLILLVVFATAGIGVSQYVGPTAAYAEDPMPLDPDFDLQRFLDGESSLSEVVPKIWAVIVSQNQDRFPNPDLVMPGEVIVLPNGSHYIAQSGGTDHMWKAAEWYTCNVVYPYVIDDTTTTTSTASVKNTTNVVTDTNDKGDWWHWWYWIPIAALVIWVAHRYQHSLRFVADPPDFRSGSDEMVRANAEAAARTAFGQVQIVGNIERGTINGEQIMFNRDGSSQIETFHNEPGYRARVRFSNGTERVVVSRWSCFNPCWSRVNSQFNGVFTPTGSKVADPIPAIQSNQIERVRQSIRGGEQRLRAEDLPSVPSVPAEPVSEPIPIAN